MAAGKEIRGKIKSVENTKKITKAMEMVAASKMRKAQERMRHARPYSREDPQHRGQPRARPTPSTRTRSWQAQRRRKARRLHRRHHRQGPVRRHEHQRAARGHDQAASELAGAGRARSQAVAIGNKGLGFLQPHRRARSCRTSRSWATRRTSRG